jgi:hypothetical protein
VERRERADVEADEPMPTIGGGLLFLSEEKTDLREDAIEGTLGTGRGEVYAEGGKDGRGRSRCFSGSSTGFLNIQLEPAIVMENATAAESVRGWFRVGVAAVESVQANLVVVVCK